MSGSSLALQISYGMTSAVALVATWWNNIHFMMKHPDAGVIGFIEAAFANHAAASLSWDLVFLGTAVTIWMIVESRRLEMKGIAVYIILSQLIAIAVMVPLFLLMRERKLAQGSAETAMS